MEGSQLNIKSRNEITDPLKKIYPISPKQYPFFETEKRQR